MPDDFIMRKTGHSNRHFAAKAAYFLQQDWNTPMRLSHEQ